MLTDSILNFSKDMLVFEASIRIPDQDHYHENILVVAPNIKRAVELVGTEAGEISSLSILSPPNYQGLIIDPELLRK